MVSAAQNLLGANGHCQAQTHSRGTHEIIKYIWMHVPILPGSQIVVIMKQATKQAVTSNCRETAACNTTVQGMRVAAHEQYADGFLHPSLRGGHASCQWLRQGHQMLLLVLLLVLRGLPPLPSHLAWTFCFEHLVACWPPSSSPVNVHA